MKKYKRHLVALLSLLMVGIISNSYAIENNTQVGRYLNVPNSPMASQADLLSQTFQVLFPESVKTIGDAMRYLLQFSGYSLVADNELIPEVKHLLALPLPQADRSLGPLTLEQGLLTLAGKPFGLLVDPVHRLVSFRLLSPYQLLYQKPRFMI